MNEQREAYTPEVLEEDKLRFDLLYGGARAKRMIVVTVVAAIGTLLVLSGVFYLVHPESFLHRLFLPGDSLLANTIQILISFFGLWVLAFAHDRFIFFRKELRVVKNKQVQRAVLALRQSGPEAAIAILNDLPPSYKSIAFFRLMWLFKQWKSVGTDFDRFYSTTKDRWALEGERIGSEYSIADVLIWAMPILGFIGTVVGISLAVGNFSSFLSISGSDIEMGLIKERLSDVASGLAFAFDTTLLGLASSLLGMLATTFTGVQENEFISRLNALSLEVVGHE